MRVICISMIVCWALMTGTVSAQAPARELTRVEGDVYRFQNNFHASVVIITNAGVVVTDPINADAATWLKAQIGELTDQPITHLVYSHSDLDHASGGDAFGNVPNVIAHINAPETIDGTAPTLRFTKHIEFSVGDHGFEMTYLGPGHGKDLAALVIRPENVGFVVDAVATKRLFYRDFPGASPDDWTQQVRNVEALDFEILVGGHGPVGVKSDVTAGRIYLEELRAQVLAGLRAGKSVDELAASITMDKYKDWISYDAWRELNVRGMARYLQESGAVEQ